MLVSYVLAGTAVGELSLRHLARAGVVVLLPSSAILPSWVRRNRLSFPQGSNVCLLQRVWKFPEKRISGGCVGVGGVSCPSLLRNGSGKISEEGYHFG